MVIRCRLSGHGMRSAGLAVAAAAYVLAPGGASAQDLPPPDDFAFGDLALGLANVNALHNRIEDYLQEFDAHQRAGNCVEFRKYTDSERFAAIDRNLQSLAQEIAQLSPDGGRKAQEDIRTFYRRFGEIERRGCPPSGGPSGTVGQQASPGTQPQPPEGPPPRVLTGEELQRVLPHVYIAAGTRVEHREETGGAQTFGLRMGGMDRFNIVRLDNTATDFAPHAAITVSPVFFHRGVLFSATVEGGTSLHKASDMRGLVSANGSDLLLPGSSNPGVFLSGGGDRTDVVDSMLSYRSRRWNIGAHLDARFDLGSRFHLSPRLGFSYRENDIGILAGGLVPKFGFGGDFGFRYKTDIHVRAAGAETGITGEYDLADMYGPIKLYGGATLGFYGQWADGKDNFELGTMAYAGGGIGTLINDMAPLSREDFALNARLSAGIAWKPEDVPGLTLGVGVGYVNTDDSYFVTRSGDVGGHAELARDRRNGVFGTLDARFMMPFM